MLTKSLIPLLTIKTKEPNKHGGITILATKEVADSSEYVHAANRNNFQSIFMNERRETLGPI